MRIVIENCSSPGASFTDNTNSVIVNIYKWIEENNKPVLPFIKFRKRLQAEKGINDNNARNIYPLLKNCGFAYYEAGSELNTKDFFTKRGEAYVKTLMAKESIAKGDYEEEKREQAINKLDTIIRKIVYDGIEKLLMVPDSNYTVSIKWFLEFVLRYEKINRYEFAYLVHEKSLDKDASLDTMTETIDAYRSGNSDIEVQVRVRNDNKIKATTGEETRLEGIGFLTSYSFYSALLRQAGLIYFKDNYFWMVTSEEDKIRSLLEGENG